MNSIALLISPSRESNDHQVRPFIDGADWLGKEYLGIDPSRFFLQKALHQGGEMLIGRCTCGCEGCGDLPINVAYEGEIVRWEDGKQLRLIFSGVDYRAEILRASNDFSWEDENRTVERLVGNVFKDTVINGLIFSWASARIQTGVISLCFSRDSSHKIVEFGWKPGLVEDAVQSAKRLRRELISD